MKQEIDNNAMWAAFRQELALQGELQVVAAIDNALNNLGFTIEETSTIVPIPLKQCGQKPADKVEPKFYEGEWLCENEPNNYARFIQILETVNVQGKERYRISRDIHNDEDVVEFDFVEKYYHKFDINDAKDGDVLAFKNNIGGIIICKSSTYYDTESYCRLLRGNFINKEESGWESTLLIPATKEQRNAIMKAMADAGYTFDFEKKELKKIVAPIFNIGDRVRYKGHACDGVITEITDTDYVCGDAKLPISTQDKLELVEQKPAWSEEDEENLKWFEKFFRAESVIAKGKDIPQDKYLWFKNIKNRVQPKQEWGKEDAYNYNIILSLLNNECVGCADKRIAIDWFNSLKDRYTWKPSEGQLECLGYAIEKAEKDWFPMTNNRIYLTLKALKEQLEKL